MKSRDQPLQLLIQNGNTNGARPLKLSFEIATDSGFKNIIFARTGIEPGGDGTTRFQLPDKLAAGTYWWRTRAEDGANSSDYSQVKSFQVLAEVTLVSPDALLPVEWVDDLRSDAHLQGESRQSFRRHGADRINPAGVEQLVLLVDRGHIHAGRDVAGDHVRQELLVPP